MDRDSMRELIAVQDFVPMRIRSIMVFNIPMWARFLIAVMRPFMKKKLKDKIKVVKGKEDLSSLVSDQNLLDCFGGSLVFKPKRIVKKESK